MIIVELRGVAHLSLLRRQRCLLEPPYRAKRTNIPGFGYQVVDRMPGNKVPRQLVWEDRSSTTISRNPDGKEFEMTLRSTSTRWGWMTRVLHWSIALVVLGMLAAGFYAGSLDTSTPAGFNRFNAVIDIHKSFGLLILMLVVVRVLWRLSERTPKLPSTVPAWERVAARATHLLLYVGLFVMPISGYLMASAHGETVRFFGITLPHVVDLRGRWVHVAHSIHHIVAFALLAIVVLHVLGALKNHFIDRNDVLRKMAGLTRETAVAPEPVIPADPELPMQTLKG
jgi:cytochrome b561